MELREREVKVYETVRDLFLFQGNQFDVLKSNQIFDPMMKMVTEEAVKEQKRLYLLLTTLGKQREELDIESMIPVEWRFPSCKEAVAEETKKLKEFIKNVIEPQAAADLAKMYLSVKEIVGNAKRLLEKPLAEAEARVASVCYRLVYPPPERRQVLALVIHVTFGVIEQAIELGQDYTKFIFESLSFGSMWEPTSSLSEIDSRLEQTKQVMDKMDDLSDVKGKAILAPLIEKPVAYRSRAMSRMVDLVKKLVEQKATIEEEWDRSRMMDMNANMRFRRN